MKNRWNIEENEVIRKYFTFNIYEFDVRMHNMSKHVFPNILCLIVCYKLLLNNLTPIYELQHNLR